MNVFGSNNKEASQKKVIFHCFLERDGVESALVQYQKGMPPRVLSVYEYDREDPAASPDTQEVATMLSQGVKNALTHFTHMYTKDGAEKDEVGSGHVPQPTEIIVSFSPLFLDIEYADVVKIYEESRMFTSFESDLEIEDVIVHREIKDVKMNGYSIDPDNAFGLIARTIEFKEEIHVAPRELSESIVEAFELLFPERDVQFASALGESTLMLEHASEVGDGWQLLYMDHDDSMLYIRGAETGALSLGYGIEELMQQLLKTEITYDEYGVRTMLRMSERGELFNKDQDMLSYTLDIESSVIEDAMLEVRVPGKELYIQTPHRVLSRLLGNALGARALHDIDPGVFEVYIPDFIKLPLHIHASIMHAETSGLRSL